MHRLKHFGFNVIKESFDQLPSGVCFFNYKGDIVLCNRQMYRLSQYLFDISEKLSRHFAFHRRELYCFRGWRVLIGFRIRVSGDLKRQRLQIVMERLVHSLQPLILQKYIEYWYRLLLIIKNLTRMKKSCWSFLKMLRQLSEKRSSLRRSLPCMMVLLQVLP